MVVVRPWQQQRHVNLLGMVAIMALSLVQSQPSGLHFACFLSSGVNVGLTCKPCTRIGGTCMHHDEGPLAPLSSVPVQSPLLCCVSVLPLSVLL